MRLLTITHYFESHGGGIERVAAHLCRAFRAAGHDTVWLAGEGGDAPDAQTAAAVPLPCYNGIERLTGLPVPLPYPTASRQIDAAVARSDAVIVHDALYATSLLAIRAARRARVPVLLVQHVGALPMKGILLRGLLQLADRAVARPALARADQVLFISDTTRAHFEGVAYRRPPLLAFNGVDTGIFHPARSTDASRAALGWPEGRPVLLFVGRFVAKKGLAILRRLAEMRPDLHLALAGHGPIDPQGWQLPNVSVHHGLAGASLAALYRAADVFVLPSVGEGYPLVIQEAMACGLPVVCAQECAMADPGARAFLTAIPVSLQAEAETAAHAAHAVDDVLRGAQGRRLAAADYARDHYSWARLAHTLVDASEAAAQRRCAADGKGCTVQPA